MINKANFIDIHSHILPNLDDGSPNLESSIKMCRIAIENGTSSIFATPHKFHPNFNVTANDRDLAIIELQKELKKEDLNIQISSGFECRINKNTIENILNDSKNTLCGNGKHFLLEFDSTLTPPQFESFLFEAKTNGLQPILVHPERNMTMIKNIDLLKNFVYRGLQIQITAGSVIGNFGKTAREFSKNLIKHNLVHYVASDFHSINPKHYSLNKAYDIILKLSGTKVANDLFFYNPKNIQNKD
jgi:protein-tyrosine phosphatase